MRLINSKKNNIASLIMFPVSQNQQIGKVYFVRTGSDKYLTVHSGFNPMTKKMMVNIANEVVGNPPPGMPEMSSKMFAMVRAGKVNGMQNLNKKG